MKKILLIDDDGKMCKELSDILRDEGYEVDTAANGTEGNDAIRSGSYDLVLLDLKLPGLTGFDILKNTARDTPGQGIVVLTGRPLRNEFDKSIADTNKEEELLLEKANYVINKPFDVEEVLDKINTLLAR